MTYSGRGAWRYLRIGVVSGLLLIAGWAVASDSFPQKEITVVIPYVAGGPTDVLLRDIFRAAQPYLGQPVSVEYMPGSGAVRGAHYVKEAASDGYTLLVSHQALDLAYLAGQASFYHAHFAPVSMLIRTVSIPTTYAGHSAQKASDIAALVSQRARPLAFGITHNSNDHFFWLQFFEQSGISPADVLMVYFPDMTSQVEALLAREIDFAMLDMPSSGQLYTSHALTALGVASSERLPGLPHVETLREQGIDLVNTTDRGILAPKDTPPERLAILASALAQAINDTQLRYRLAYDYGSLIDYRPLAAYSNYMDEQFHVLVPLAEQVHFKR
ncbi:tripartite-type tricarboxylate transporter receptor subunit TctC [Vreelandella songnenensis]|uniref:Tripartite-type tricarboxylate transporter receptor subunit TctC n=1 Tax=Vreelandella songnenensis TaxID=1176243 RepID=A0A2T0V2V2_9GAMM|nr:tripartite tricarboxylate transporter substrate binding protein [Halomonas songnenensis]PRY64447.1 tripartite-type tricarboxylate transporter receptor subunit TctC [Halomonas songnenensis]